MKKHGKRWLLALLCLVLALAVGLPVFAADMAPTDGEGVPPATAAAGEAGGQDGAPAGEDEAPPQDDPAGEPAPDAEGPASGVESPAGEAEPVPGEDAADGEAPEANAPEEGTVEPEAEADSGAGEPNPADGKTDAKSTPYGLVLDETSIVVGSYDELGRALGEDNGYTTIYLGAHITANQNSISIHPGKPFVIVDGSPPAGGRYTFTQYAAIDTRGVLLVDSDGTATTSVTLRNMDIVGKNDFGVVWVKNSITTVTLTLENVNYTGPQPLHHRNGTVRVLGGRYTLGPGELAEALHVELGGALTVEGPATGGNAVLWLVSTASTLRLLENADVTVNAKNYLVYGSISAATLEAGARLRLTAGRFGFSYAGDSVGSFTMAQGAGLYISLHTSESYAALRVSRLFSMAPGSTATIIRTGTAGIPLRLTAAGAKAVFDRPQRVFLYSSAGVPLRFTGAGTLSITTSALNVWTKSTWPVAAGMDGMPTHIWNRAGGAPLTVAGTYSEAANQRLEHNLLADDPVASELTAKHFNLENSQLVVFGAGALDIDNPTSESPALAGGAAPGATLQATYILADGQGGKIGGTSDMMGRYSLPVTGGALMVGSGVEVISRDDGLFMRQRATVQDADGYRLRLVGVPGTVGFGALPVPTGHTLVERQEELAITVQDTRLSPGPWRLDASLDGPLVASVGQGQARLPGAVVFKTADGRQLTLDETPQPVYSQAGGTGGTVELRWGPDEGVLLALAPGQVYSGAEYRATIHWSLVDAP